MRAILSAVVVSVAALLTACGGSSRPAGATGPAARHAYVSTWSSGGAGTVVQLAVRADGTLDPGAVTTGFQYPAAVLVGQASRFLYVSDDRAVHAYGIGTDGALAPIGTGPSYGGWAAIDPSRRFIYTSYYGGSVWQLAAAADGTLTGTWASTSLNGTAGMGFHPWLPYAYVPTFSGHAVVRIAIQADGTLDLASASSVASGANPRSIVLTPDGRFAYVNDIGTDGVGATIWQYAVSEAGALDPLNPATVDSGMPDALALAPDGSTLYVGDADLFRIRRFAVGADGKLTRTGAEVATPGVGKLAVDRGGFLYATSDASVVAQFRIAADGALEPLSPPTVTVAPGASTWGMALVP